MLLCSLLTSSQEFYPVSLFSFSSPTKKWGKNKSFPKQKQRCVAQITRSLWCFGIFGYPHQLLSLRSFTLVDINLHTNPFFVQIFGPTKNGHVFFFEQKKNRPPPKRQNGPTKKSPPPLAHQDFIGTCGTGANEASGSGLRGFRNGKKCPSKKLTVCPWKYVVSQKEAGSFFPLPAFF